MRWELAMADKGERRVSRSFLPQWNFVSSALDQMGASSLMVPVLLPNEAVSMPML